MWNRWRSPCGAGYDRLMALVGFDEARRRSIDGLALRGGDHVLIVGAGTGLDLPWLPGDVHVTAVDMTPAMLARLERRAHALGRAVAIRDADARALPFPDACRSTRSSFT